MVSTTGSHCPQHLAVHVIILQSSYCVHVVHKSKAVHAQGKEALVSVHSLSVLQLVLGINCCYALVINELAELLLGFILVCVCVCVFIHPQIFAEHLLCTRLYSKPWTDTVIRPSP